MPLHGAITLGDIAGRTTWIAIECKLCGRAGRYSVARLLEERGPNLKLPYFKAEVTADCPKVKAAMIYDQCQATITELDAELRELRPSGWLFPGAKERPARRG